MIELPAGWTLVLASASPRRARLLHTVGLRPEIRPADVDESVRPGESPLDYVARLASAKAEVHAAPRNVVIAADTTVEVDGDVLGKPLDDTDARAMLRRLGGRTHHVHTGVAVLGPGGRHELVVSTAVTFVELGDALVEWYVSTGEPADKAGGYAIQGAGAALVRRVEGSVSNVIGLPLAETLAALASTLG